MLYRGPLASCNYDCSYCPFAKHASPASELREDRAALQRFVGWVVEQRDTNLSILFTPWGEALVRSWYRDALVELSHTSHVTRVAIQTNLSCRLDWLEAVDRERLALWVTFHPEQVDYSRFLTRCLALHDAGQRFSVGIVGVRENLEACERLRRDLPPSIYLWVNAYKSEGPEYYNASEVERLSAVDPLFAVNNRRHPSLGRSCATGHTAITVDGHGDVRRCHFVAEVLGHLYRDSLDSILAPRPCPNTSCGCYIGYVHLAELELSEVYGRGLLERIPKSELAPGGRLPSFARHPAPLLQIRR